MSKVGIVAGLTDSQRRAVQATGADVLLAAGAGSGKTRTLVARYLTELERGFQPRELAAITFTEKAAREMRNRIRRAAEQRATEVEGDQQAEKWRQTSAAMEGARIGTIHSLCAEIMRNHPAEAGIDPEFEVLEEGAARLLQYEAVEAAMAAAAHDPQAVSIYRHYSTWALQSLLLAMIDRRLEVAPYLLGPDPAGGEAIDAWVRRKLVDFVAEVAAPLNDLIGLQERGYFQQQATKTMAEMAAELLEGWQQFESELQQGNAFQAARTLFDLRRNSMRSRVGRQDGPARAAIDQLQTAYDRTLNPWLGGQSSRDKPPDPELEARMAEVVKAAAWIFRRAHDYYQTELANRAAVDFDGLEAGAVELLQREEVKAEWQAKLRRVLVDEFQDTNQRQRQIIEALCADEVGKLFVVGDAQQSIYRFRGADVTIFQQLRDQLEETGHSLRLRRTFRQHPELLAVFESLFPTILETGDQKADYRVPYQSLSSDRADPLAHVEPPYLEFQIGVGELAADARPIAAGLLANRLLNLFRTGEVTSWDQIVLLFRASTGFSSYEDALSQAQIPYVTVAGRGFYERPEIREVLNILRALAEPWNQAAMVGLLRSAAVGISDVGIFRLRIGDNGPRPLLDALNGEPTGLSQADELGRQRALAMIETFSPMVDRVPVADLLKRWMDWADARALLAIAGERHWANLDKLLVDARRSGTIKVRGFLEYLKLTQQAGVREGEAPAEVSGAVRLMTVHKSKGLEFPYVVVADAGYQRRSTRPPFLVQPGLGLAMRPDLWDGASLRYRYAKALELDQEAAEEDRLLYVALTRAQEKVIISGHGRAHNGGIKTAGWLQSLLLAAGIDPAELDRSQSSDLFDLVISEEYSDLQPIAAEPSPDRSQEASQTPLFPPIGSRRAATTDDDFDEPPARAWRASGRRQPPAAVVGVLVHRAFERWLFPPNPALEHLLRVSAIGEGLVEGAAQQAAIDHALELLARFKDHELRQIIESSEERYHELPFTYEAASGRPDSGAIDLLYRRGDKWKLLDFKTDVLTSAGDVEEAMARHELQLNRYQAAAERLLSEGVQSSIVFLDAMGEVQVVERHNDRE